MEDGSQDVELFGALRLPRGGKHGYRGVRGGQGRRRARFQAYATIDGLKVTVPGLFGSAHEAAVALAQWKQQRALGLDEEPPAKKPRKKRSPAAAQQPSACDSTARYSQLPRMPLLLIQTASSTSPLPPASEQLPQTPVTSSAVPLPAGVPAAAYGVPVALGQLA